MRVFVPVSEEMMERLGLSPDDLVPFDLAYEVFHLDPSDSEDPSMTDLVRPRTVEVLSD